MAAIELRTEGGTGVDCTFIVSLSVPYQLNYARMHFSGSAGSATLNIYLHYPPHQFPAKTYYDSLLYYVPNLGVGSDLHLRVTAEEVPNWTFQPTHSLKFSWEAPGAGIDWGLIVGLNA